MLKYECEGNCKPVKNGKAKPCIIEIDECWNITEMCIPLGDNRARYKQSLGNMPRPSKVEDNKPLRGR